MRSLFSFDEMNVVSKDTESGSEANGTTGGYSAENINLGTVDTTALDTVDEKLQALFQRIQDGIKPTVTALKNLWEQGLSRLGKFTIDGLKDFYEHFLVPVGKWTLGEGIPRLVNALNDGLMRVDFEKSTEALKDCGMRRRPLLKGRRRAFVAVGKCSGALRNLDGK